MVHTEVKLTVTLKLPLTVWGTACAAGIKVSIEASPTNINFVFVI
jgi:hypothetical protein